MTLSKTVLTEIVDTFNGKSYFDLDPIAKVIFNILELNKIVFQIDGLVTSHEHTPGIKIRKSDNYEIVQDEFKTKKEAEDWLRKELTWEDGELHGSTLDDFDFIGKEIVPDSTLYQYKIKQPIILGGHADKNKQSLTSHEVLKVNFRVINGDKGFVKFTGYDLDLVEGTAQAITTLREPVLVTHLGLTEQQAHQIANEIVYKISRIIGFNAIQ